LTPQLGAAVRERTAAKVVADGSRYLLHEDGERILFIGRTNQVKPLIDHIVLTDMRLVGILLSHPAESPKVQAWWPQIRSFSVSDKWSSKNRLTVVTHEGMEIHFGAVREADLPWLRAQIEQFMSPAYSSVVLRRLADRKERERAIASARRHEEELRAREWQRYREESATTPPAPPLARHQPTPSAEPGPVPTPHSPEPRVSLAEGTEYVPDVSPDMTEANNSGGEHVVPAPDVPNVEDGSVEADERTVAPVGDRSFLAEVAEARKKPRKWPYLLLMCELAGIIMGGSGWIVMAAGFVIAVAMASWENERSRPRFSYDLTGDEAAAFGDVLAAFRASADAGRVWLITGQRSVDSEYERKTNAGAGIKTTRVSASLSFAGLAGIVTDVEAPTIAAGPYILHLYPDRFLLGEKGRFTEHRYDDLQADADVTQFVESATLPSDAVVVGHTWTYVNVRGGPDRRYKDNRKLPIALYGELTLRAGDAKLVLMMSAADAPERLRTALRRLGAR